MLRLLKFLTYVSFIAFFVENTAKILGVAQNNKDFFLYFLLGRSNDRSLHFLSSQNGYEFSKNSLSLSVIDNSQKEERKFDWQSLRLAKVEENFFLTYKSTSPKTPQLFGAISKDLVHWEKTGEVDHITEIGTIVPHYKYRGQHIMYYGEKEISLAHSGFLYQWNTFAEPVLSPRKKFFDSHGLEFGNTFVLDDRILLLYYVKNTTEKHVKYSVGAAFFDINDPTECIERSDTPFWEFPDEYQYKDIRPLGSVLNEHELLFYWIVNEAEILVTSCLAPNRNLPIKQKSFSAILKKSEKNPIIAPNPENPWESRATFNSAAVYEDGKVHFIYRALGDKDLSVLGYATSSDGITIDERLQEPIYIPREPFETPGQNVFKTFADHFASGGGYGGVEDPRITKVDDTLYMTYVAFDGANPPRVALTSIEVSDFLNRRWDKWKSPKLISAPGMVNKNAVIFPEKINGKYVVFHRIYPNILVDYVDDLDFDNYLQGHYFIPPRKNYWDSKKIGAGAPPIKTDDGWLFVYQSVGYQEPHKYKIGAMLLDLHKPTKVLHRTSTPIIEPVEAYENEGFKSGVVYPCGAVAMNNKLHIYYGGADTVVCAASTDLDHFLHEMKHDRQPRLKRITNIKFN